MAEVWTFIILMALPVLYFLVIAVHHDFIDMPRRRRQADLERQAADETRQSGPGSPHI